VDYLFAASGGRGHLKLDLWGGEPFVRLDLIERIAARATSMANHQNRVVRVGIPTNVTLLDDDALAVVTRWNLHLSLSLDGTPEAHALRKTRGGQNGWSLIEPRLRHLIDVWRGPLPPVRMTVVPARADRVFEDLRFLLDLGFRRIAFLPASGASWTDQETEAFDASMREVADDFAARLRRGDSDLPSYPHLLRRMAPWWVQRGGRAPAARRGMCGAGETLSAVDTRGDLYPCHRVVAMPRPPTDLRLGTLAEGVTNEPLAARLASLGADHPDVRCATCEHRKVCGTICIALNHRVTGDVAIVPDEACFVTERLRRAARYIHESLQADPRYDALMETYVSSDPDDRFLPLLSSMETDDGTAALMQEIEEALASPPER